MADLTMTQTMVPDSRSPDRASKWRAVCCIDGQEYEAISRHGAPYELARVLVKAGIPDQPVLVVCDGVVGEVTCRSLHKMSKWTLSEGVTTPLQLRRYVEPDFSFARPSPAPAEPSPAPPDVSPPAAPDVLPKTGVRLRRPAA